MDKREILVVAPDFYPTNGGYAHAVTNLCRHLSRLPEYSITVLTLTPLSNYPELIEPNLKILRAKKVKRFGRYGVIFDEFKLGYILKKLIRKKEWHFVLIETFENPLAKWIALKALPEHLLHRVAIRIHGCTETEIFRYSQKTWHKISFHYARKLAMKIPNILSTTEFYIDFFIKHILNGNIYDTFKNYGVLPNLAESFKSNGRAQSIQANPSHRFLVLGRMNKQGYNQKNFELIAQALYLIKQTEPEIYKAIEITLVGCGPCLRIFEKVIAGLGVSDRFRILDTLPHEEVRAFQATVDGVILVSRYEGQSMFALEALAAGAPLIVSEDSGITDLVHEGENGFRIDPNNPNALAQALLKMCRANPDSLRQQSRRIYAEHYQPETILRKLTHYMEICRHSFK